MIQFTSGICFEEWRRNWGISKPTSNWCKKQTPRQCSLAQCALSAAWQSCVLIVQPHQINCEDANVTPHENCPFSTARPSTNEQIRFTQMLFSSHLICRLRTNISITDFDFDFIDLSNYMCRQPDQSTDYYCRKWSECEKTIFKGIASGM